MQRPRVRTFFIRKNGGGNNFVAINFKKESVILGYGKRINSTKDKRHGTSGEC